MHVAGHCRSAASHPDTTIRMGISDDAMPEGHFAELFREPPFRFPHTGTGMESRTLD